MGVDYSSSIGYGVAVLRDDASDYLKSFQPWEDEGQISSIMDAAGWDLIGYDYCGDMMGGNMVYFFYIKGTEILHADYRYSDSIITEFADPPVISDDALRQLNGLAEHFDIKGSIGWKLILNVS